MKDGRDGGRTGGDEGFVADRTDDEERTRLSCTVLTAQTQIRQLVEGVVDPGEEDVVRGDLPEAVGEIDVAVEVSVDLANEIGNCGELLRPLGEKQYLVFD